MSGIQSPSECREEAACGFSSGKEAEGKQRLEPQTGADTGASDEPPEHKQPRWTSSRQALLYARHSLCEGRRSPGREDVPTPPLTQDPHPERVGKAPGTRQQTTEAPSPTGASPCGPRDAPRTSAAPAAQRVPAEHTGPMWGPLVPIQNRAEHLDSRARVAGCQPMNQATAPLPGPPVLRLQAPSPVRDGARRRQRARDSLSSFFFTLFVAVGSPPPRTFSH